MAFGFNQLPAPVSQNPGTGRQSGGFPGFAFGQNNSLVGGFGQPGFGFPPSQQGGQQQQQQQNAPSSAPLIRTTQSQPGFLNPGDPHPFNDPNATNVHNGLIAPPPPPGSQYTDSFLPPALLDPFTGGMNAAAQIGSYASQAVPQAAAFQQGLYAPGLNQFESGMLGSSASLGLRGLESAFNQINSQYENTPFASTRFRQMTDAGNQFAEQLMNIGSQLGLQRQQIATQNLPVAFGTPLQAAQAQQQGASGLLNLAQQGVTGDLNFPLAAYSGYPVVSPAIVQSGGGGGKK